VQLLHGQIAKAVIAGGSCKARIPLPCGIGNPSTRQKWARGNDPQWIAANDASGKPLAVQDDHAAKLLESEPPTVPGIR